MRGLIMRGPVVLGLVAMAGLMAHAENFDDAVGGVLACRAIADPSEKLACYEAAAEQLDAAVAAEAARTAAGTEVATAAPAPDAGAEAPVPATAAASVPATPAPAATAPMTSVACRAAPDTEESVPVWARLLPGFQEKNEREKNGGRKDPTANELSVSVVRIQRNNAGRHFFTLSDGQVWRQIEPAEVRPPSALPAPATIRKAMIGNPWFEFDEHPTKDYKVIRIE